MIIGGNKERVIANIRQAAESRDYHAKVEVDDPQLTAEQRSALVEKYLRRRSSAAYHIKNRAARTIVDAVTRSQNRSTEIVGLENIRGITGGAIITSNHFDPLDNTVIRTLAKRTGRKRLYVVSQETNLAMTGLIGFLMNYTDIIPISPSAKYMQDSFPGILKSLLDNGQFVLIYPEQEMWFRYRKPRPPKRGAYYYAAKLGVPVISCFVEMRDEERLDNEAFHKVKNILHVLPVVAPDLNKSARENSIRMMEQDYKQKKEAYEAAYGEKLSYAFQDSDIAGWIPHSCNISAEKKG